MGWFWNSIIQSLDEETIYDIVLILEFLNVKFGFSLYTFMMKILLVDLDSWLCSKCRFFHD